MQPAQFGEHLLDRLGGAVMGLILRGLDEVRRDIRREHAEEPDADQHQERRHATANQRDRIRVAVADGGDGREGPPHRRAQPVDRPARASLGEGDHDRRSDERAEREQQHALHTSPAHDRYRRVRRPHQVDEHADDSQRLQRTRGAEDAQRTQEGQHHDQHVEPVPPQVPQPARREVGADRQLGCEGPPDDPVESEHDALHPRREIECDWCDQQRDHEQREHEQREFRHVLESIESLGASFLRRRHLVLLACDHPRPLTSLRRARRTRPAARCCAAEPRDVPGQAGADLVGTARHRVPAAGARALAVGALGHRGARVRGLRALPRRGGARPDPARVPRVHASRVAAPASAIPAASRRSCSRRSSPSTSPIGSGAGSSD